MNKITVTINNRTIQTDPGLTILQAAAAANITIPTLCYLKDRNEIAACRMCIVEIKGYDHPVPSCTTKVKEGMEILTDTPELLSRRKDTLELVCSNHRFSCEACSRYSDCELHALMSIYGIDEYHLKYGQGRTEAETETGEVHLVRDHSKCLLCQRCINACRERNGSSCIHILNRGETMKITAGPDLPQECTHCGSCIQACPTGALTETDATREIWMSVASKKNYTVAILSPFSSCFGELLQFPMGENGLGKLVAALRKIGFDAVYDGNQGAAFAVEEIVETLKSSPEQVYTGTCMASIRRYRNTMDGFTSTPQEKLLPVVLSESAKKFKVPESQITVVSIDPCTAMKGAVQGMISATIREIAVMYKRACVSRFTARQVWQQLEEEPFDPLPVSTKGRGYAENGSLLAAAVQDLGGSAKQLSEQRVEFTYEINGSMQKSISIGSIVEFEKLRKEKAFLSEYQGVEILACKEGCLLGGGMPRLHSAVLNDLRKPDFRTRSQALSRRSL